MFLNSFFKVNVPIIVTFYCYILYLQYNIIEVNEDILHSRFKTEIYDVILANTVLTNILFIKKDQILTLRNTLTVTIN